MRVTTVRMTRPRMSSAIAAPSTVFASTLARARRSPNTRAVMPTLVAVNAAPTNTASLPDIPSPRPTTAPPANGNATPAIATRSDARPTLANSPRSVSKPTSRSNRMTPSSASVASAWLLCTRPSADGPTRIPATISPTTAGTPTRSAISAATLAATSTTRMSSRIRLTSTVRSCFAGQWPESVACM